MENMVIENRNKKLTQEIEKKCVEMVKLINMGINFRYENRLNGSTVVHFAVIGIDLFDIMFVYTGCRYEYDRSCISFYSSSL
jgi:hypothetical protein